MADATAPDTSAHGDEQNVTRIVPKLDRTDSTRNLMAMDLQLNTQLSAAYKSLSQKARITTESWVVQQLPCPSCDQPLRSLVANAKSADVECSGCQERFQIKSQSKPFSKKLLGAEYNTTKNAVTSGTHPSMILLHYDPSSMRVQRLELVHRSWITESVIIPRKELSNRARRAGWKGCNFALDDIPLVARIEVVCSGQATPMSAVNERWKVAQRISSHSAESRGWMSDVLSVVDRLPHAFNLQDVYVQEPLLAKRHPQNQHVRPKIRQQLQAARDLGFVEFLGDGQYRKVVHGVNAT
jgi:type II restriction enzyme